MKNPEGECGPSTNVNQHRAHDHEGETFVPKETVLGWRKVTEYSLHEYMWYKYCYVELRSIEW